MKRIAHRTDKWDYSGGDIGNIWVDIKGRSIIILYLLWKPTIKIQIIEIL